MTVTGWTTAELAVAASARELLVSPDRRDGTRGSSAPSSPFVPVWLVAVGDAVYVRTDPSYGSVSHWYRRALASGTGRIRLGDRELAATFSHVEPTDAATHLIDEAYLAKYGESSMVSAGAQEHTLRIEPVAA